MKGARPLALRSGQRKPTGVPAFREPGRVAARATERAVAAADPDFAWYFFGGGSEHG